ncbi:hypothetical protein AK88_00338 [Plasmodium fragile]|uniref:Uncharacterized protein n=1 Tax=Plasmodium fragile TaxID=5857 RepID=A0A0D9QSQ7_PLAFR|nr:uncharacterized protein AK88_00338 [Plasmodium fragile]KJP89882.1 hypothetical protein AK88_00338 [Plasmodium fragile]
MNSGKINGNVPRKDNDVKDDWNAYENYGAGHGKNNHVCVHIHNNIHLYYNPGDNLCSIDRVINTSSNNVIDLDIFQNKKRDVQDIGKLKNNFHFNKRNELYRDIALLVWDSWLDSGRASVHGWAEAGCISDAAQRYFTTSSCNKSGVNCSHNCAPPNDASICSYANPRSKHKFASDQQNASTKKRMSEEFRSPRNNHNKQYFEKEHSTNQLNFYDNDSNGNSPKLTGKHHQFSNNHDGSRIAVLKKKDTSEVKLQSLHGGGPHEGGKHTQIVNIPPGNYRHDKSDCTVPELQNGKSELSYNSAIDAFMSGEYVNCENFRCDADGLGEHSNIGGIDCAYKLSDAGERSSSFGNRESTQGGSAKGAATKCNLPSRDKWDKRREVHEQGKIFSPRKWCEVVSCPTGNQPEGNDTLEKIEKWEFQKNSMHSDTNGGENMPYFDEQLIKKSNLSGTHHSHIPVEEKKKKNWLDSENGSSKLNGERKGGNGPTEGIKLTEKSTIAEGLDDNLISNWALHTFEDDKLSYDRVCKFDDNKNCLNGSCESVYTNDLIKSDDGRPTSDPQGRGNTGSYYMESKPCSTRSIHSVHSEECPKEHPANGGFDNNCKKVLPARDEEYFHVEQNGCKEDSFHMNSHNFQHIFNQSANEQSSHSCYEKDLHSDRCPKSPVCKNDTAYNENNYTHTEDTYVENKKKNICEEKNNNAKIDLLKKATAYDQVSASNGVSTDSYINKQINSIFGDFKKDGHLSEDNIAQIVHGTFVREKNFLFQKSIDMEIEKKEHMKYNPTTLLQKNQYLKNNFSNGNYEKSEKLNGHNNNILTFNVAQHFLENNKHDNISCKSINVGSHESKMFTTATTISGQGQGNDLHEFLHFCDENQVGSEPRGLQLYDLLEIYDRNNYTVPIEEATQDEFVEIYDTINGTGRKENNNMNDEFLEISHQQKNSIMHVEDEFLHIREKLQNSAAGPQEDEFLDIYNRIVSAKNAQVDEFSDICSGEERFQQMRQRQRECWGEQVLGNAERKCLEKADRDEGGKSGNNGQNAQSEQSDQLHQSRGNHFTPSYNARKKVKQSEPPDLLEDPPQGNKSSVSERPPNYSSFTYASGKDVNINKDVLNEMRKKLFGDDDEGEGCSTMEAIPTQGSTEVKPSSSHNYSFSSVHLPSEIVPPSNGKDHKPFTYASGKEVSINRDVLNRMRETLFGDDDVVSDNANNSSSNNNNSNSGNNSIGGAREQPLGSFTYASGKEVNINKDVLSQMRDKLFGDDEHLENGGSCLDNMRKKKTHIDLNIRNGDKIEQRNENQLGYASLTLVHPLGSEEDKGGKEAESRRGSNFSNANKVNLPDGSEHDKHVITEQREIKVEEVIKKNKEDEKQFECTDPQSKDIKVECTQKGILPSGRDQTGDSLHEGVSVKEEELCASEGCNEIVNTEANLLHSVKYKGSSTECGNTTKGRVGGQMLRSDVKSKNNFVNPRKRKLSEQGSSEQWVHERGEINHTNKTNATSIGKKNKQLDLSLNLRDHLKLIRDMYTLLAKRKKLKGNRRLTNSLMYVNENKQGYTFNWSDNDYLYFLKNEKLNEYYTADVTVLYELFVLTAKQLNIFHSYDFAWFLKKYKLVTMVLVRKYTKELQRRYKLLREGERFHYNRSYFHEGKEHFGEISLECKNEDKRALQGEHAVVLKPLVKEEKDERHKEGCISPVAEGCAYGGKAPGVNPRVKSELFSGPVPNGSVLRGDMHQCGVKMSETSGTVLRGEVARSLSPEYTFHTCEFGQRMRRSTQPLLTIRIMDEVEPPSPIEFMFKLLKRYVEEKKNKKSILQMMLDNTVSYKVPVNLRVEKIIKNKDNEFILILSDNFEYIHCTPKDSYLKNLIMSNIIKQGNVLRINGLDLQKETQEQNQIQPCHKSMMLFSLSSNDLIEIDQQNNLKVGLTKYKAKRIKHIEHWGNSCFFVDVIIISKSDLSYGFFDSVKKKYYLIHSNVYEKIIYNLRHEMSKLLEEENFQEDARYIKVKNDLNMFLEATSFCIVQAIDFAVCERIRGETSLDNKIEHIINSMCRVKFFRINMETYESLRRGSRIQMFNVYVQKSKNNNKFSRVRGEDNIDDFIYGTFEDSNRVNHMMKALNYDSFESHFFKEEMKSKNEASEGSYPDNYPDDYMQNSLSGFVGTGKKHTPIIFQATQATYINLDDKYRSKLFQELKDMVTLASSTQGNQPGRKSQTKLKRKEQQVCYPSFIYTNLFKIPVLSRIHMALLRNYAKINVSGKFFYYDLIQGNLYTLSGVIVHYTDVEVQEVMDYAGAEDKKKVLFYKVFLLTSNGNLCCVSISMITPDSLLSTYMKDFEYKEREILKKMIHIQHVETSGVQKGEHKKGQADNRSVASNNRNHLYNYLYKVERNNTESPSKEDMENKNVDVVMFFKDVEFINYDEKCHIYNFRSYDHPHFHPPRLYSDDFEHTKRSIAELIRGKYIECEKNRLIVKLTDSWKIKIEKDNLPHMHFLYLLIYSKSKSIELTGVHLKNNYLSNFLKNIWNVFVK